MVTNQQVRILIDMLNKGKPLYFAAAKSGMSEKTARKYRDIGKYPSEIKNEHNWKTRKDPFEDVWNEIQTLLDTHPKIQSTTILDYLMEKHPGKFEQSHLRTLQRKVKKWRGLYGKPKEVYFPQTHYPGDLSESDFTSMNDMDITIDGMKFDHMLFHFVLTYSNWEYVNICFSECYESLSEGIQNALWLLGKVPIRHRTDSLSAAVKNLHKKKNSSKELTDRYQSLLRYYSIEGENTNPNSPNENGDVEQSHYRYKNAVEQALMIRGSRNFKSREEYKKFLKKIFDKRNSLRTEKLTEELLAMKNLPVRRLEDYKLINVRVTKYSTIRVSGSVYSVHSRLIGETLKVKLYSEHLEIFYSDKHIETIPRMKGISNHFIQYQHIIDYLIRKPNAFKNYKYREDLFPTTNFRIAYDYFSKYTPIRAVKEYLKILYLASKEGETKVDEALRYILDNEKPLMYETVTSIVFSNNELKSKTDIEVDDIDLSVYDELLSRTGGI